MKTLTKTFFATTLTAIVLTTSAFTTFAAKNDKAPVVITAPATFNKIQITGNVNVVLVQKSKEEIQVDENFNPAKTSIQQKGYTLMINSTEINRTTVRIFVKDLQRIDVSGISTVETKGDFDLKYLQIFVSNSAVANVKANTGSLYTVLKDEGALKLSGMADEHTFIAAQDATANLDKFVCLHTNKTISEPLAVVRIAKK